MAVRPYCRHSFLLSIFNCIWTGQRLQEGFELQVTLLEQDGSGRASGSIYGAEKVRLHHSCYTSSIKRDWEKEEDGEGEGRVLRHP